jgi:hypothetical protein
MFVKRLAFNWEFADCRVEGLTHYACHIVNLSQVCTTITSIKSITYVTQLPPSLFRVGNSALYPGLAQTRPSTLGCHVGMT